MFSEVARLLICAGVVAAGLTLPDQAAAADLGNCKPYTPIHPHQGGYETDLTGDSRGVYVEIYVKWPDLCNNPTDRCDSASIAYDMIAPPVGVDGWYQVGTIRRAWGANPCTGPQDVCSVYFMQYNPGNGGALVTDYAGSWPSSITWYRFVLKKIDADVDYWSAYVLKHSDGVPQWFAPRDPAQLAWTPGDSEYSSEVLNEADQAGGSFQGRLTFNNAAWWTSTFSTVFANMQGAERACQFCDANGPYNINWNDGNTFEVWTDGF